MNFPTESATGWEEVLRGLQKRGLKRLGLIVADGLSGLETATARVFPDRATKPRLQTDAEDAGSYARQRFGHLSPWQSIHDQNGIRSVLHVFTN